MQTIKSVKIFLIALVVCSNMFSQTNVYKPFPGENAIWSVDKNSMSGLAYYKYKTFGDTLIGIQSYKNVSVSFSPNNPFNFGPYSFNFAYRNDSINKKVYYLDVTGGLNKDTLWYDFNLNVGDTVRSTYAYGRNHISRDRVVESIDSVSVCGSYHKRFNFNCMDNESDLVEGVGFMDHFVRSYRNNECPFEPVEVFHTGFSTCYFTSVKERFSDNLIKIFPNPAGSELKINSLFQITEYTIINNVGAVSLKGNLSDSQSINVSSLADGLYVVEIKNKSGKQYQSKFIKQ